MITDPDQIEALIEATRDLIEEDGMDVVLQRTALVHTAAGGIRRNGSALPLTSVRRFFGASTADPPRVIREEGEQIVLRHVLIGMPDDDIEEKDYFIFDDRKFEVIDVDQNSRAWQTKGWVVERS